MSTIQSLITTTAESEHVSFEGIESKLLTLRPVVLEKLQEIVQLISVEDLKPSDLMKALALLTPIVGLATNNINLRTEKTIAEQVIEWSKAPHERVEWL